MTRRQMASWFAIPAIFGGSAKARPAAPAHETIIDSDGTAHITRTIPVPKTLSTGTQAMLASGKEFAPNGWTEESAQLVQKARSVYPVHIEDATLAGVKVKLLTRNDPPRTNATAC